MAGMCRVTGRIADSAGRVLERVVFVPRAVEGVIDSQREVAVRLTDGVLDVRLAPGLYDVLIGRSRYRVEVPDQTLAAIGTLIDAARG